MASIYWRNGIAWARARVKGVEYRESLDTSSAREAKERFESWLIDLKRKRTESKAWQVKGETSFKLAVDKFTDEHLPQLRPNAQRRYLTSLIQIAPFFEHKTLQSISKADLMAFVSARRKKGLSNGTIRRDLACLSSVFTIAEDWELVEGNPVSSFMRIQKKRGLKEAPPRDRYLSHDEERRLLLHGVSRIQRYMERESKRLIMARMIVCAFIVGIDTGLRSDELLGLKWPQVDLFQSQVTVLAENAKNKTMRQVPLLPRSLDILSRLDRHPSSPYVFWNRQGEPFYDLNHTFQRMASEVGIEGVRFHDLRRTCGCRLLQDLKLPIERVSAWLGHKTVKQTQDAYAFLNVSHLHDAVGTISSTNAGTIEFREELKLLNYNSLFGSP